MENLRMKRWVGVNERCEGIAAELRVLSSIAGQTQAEQLMAIASMLDELAEEDRMPRH